jgi:ComF family protein
MWRAIRPWLFPVWCAGCACPDVGLCPGCASTAIPASFAVDGMTVRAAGDYAGPVRTAVLAVKRGERAYLDPLARLLAPLVPEGCTIVPVPTTSRRRAERGFDQACELARRVAAWRNGTYLELLRKHGAAQRGLGRERRLQATGRFSLRFALEGPRVAVLVDDVITTGATLRDAAAVLTAGGCTVAGAVVVARTSLGRETRRLGGRLVEA